MTKRATEIASPGGTKGVYQQHKKNIYMKKLNLIFNNEDTIIEQVALKNS